MPRLLSLFTMTIVLLGAGASGFMEPGGARGLTAQDPASFVLDPARLAEMQYHFIQITRVQEAVIRGDLEAVRSPARELSALPMPWRVPASASPPEPTNAAPAEPAPAPAAAKPATPPAASPAATAPAAATPSNR